MAEETTTPTAPPEEDEAKVPSSRLRVEREKRQDAERRLGELADRLEQLENRDKTDVERLTRDLEKAQKRAAEATEQVNRMEADRVVDQKRGWVQAAASKLNFHDPGEAALLADLESIDDPKSAEQAVKAMAKDRPWAVRTDQAEGARLRRVGADGQVEDDKQPLGITPEEQEQRWGEEMFTGLMGQKPPSATEA